MMRVKSTRKVFFILTWITPTESTRKFTKAHCKRNIGFSPKHDLRGLRGKGDVMRKKTKLSAIGAQDQSIPLRKDLEASMHLFFLQI
jgi:hypothetical protein